jgi:DNA-binding HxlR family transcriptional regulator
MSRNHLEKTKPLTPQEIEKNNTEVLILDALENGALRWKDLKAKMKTSVKSTRTLSTRLQELQAKGLVRRIVDDKVYPPAVSYELSSNAVLVEGNTALVATQLKQLLKELRENRQILKHFINSNTSTEDVLMHYIDDYVMDFLYIMNSSFENPQLFPYIMFNMKELYAGRMANLFEYWQKNPEMKKTVKEVYEKATKENQEDIDKNLSNWTVKFADQSLAKAVFKLYAVKLVKNELVYA